VTRRGNCERGGVGESVVDEIFGKRRAWSKFDDLAFGSNPGPVSGRNYYIN